MIDAARTKAFSCVGIDLSLNHAAVVSLVTEPDGQHRTHMTRILTTVESVAQLRDREHKGTYLKRPKNMTKSQWEAYRLWCIRTFLLKTFGDLKPDFACLENYAFSRGNRAHQIGEAGGLVRLIMWDLLIPYRLHDPKTVKLFATGKATADKEEVQAEASIWSPSRKLLNAESLGDVCDAYFLAKIGVTECLLRRGALQIEDLPKHQARAFTRKTKAYPTPLLERPWIHWTPSSIAF